MRRFSVYYGVFNHFQTKICQTKPNSETPKMNITDYITGIYSNNPELLKVQKQSQTNPNEPNFLSAIRGAKPKQTQSNPILLTVRNAGLRTGLVFEPTLGIVLRRTGNQEKVEYAANFSVANEHS
jgi:hypothetical protein